MPIRFARLAAASAALLAPAVLLATAGPAVAAPAAEAPPGVFKCNWNGAQPPGPAAPQTEVQFDGISATSPCDVWAVGFTVLSSSRSPIANIEHWTGGGSWTTVPNPFSDAAYSLLQSVSADSASDAWAVGTTIGNDGVQRSILAHWDGTSWNKVDPPDPADDGPLYSVSADSPTDAWALGYPNPDGSAHIMHWDGTALTDVKVPGSGQYFMQAISAASPDDVWAVGTRTDASNQNHPVGLHWDGSSWTETSMGDALFSGVVTLASGAAYAVGYGGSDNPRYVARWDGSSWSQVSLPALPASLGDPASKLTGVAASSGTDVWVSGYGAPGGGTTKSVALHWDGSSWKWLTTTAADGHDALAVTSIAPGGAWFAGVSADDTQPYAAPMPVVPAVHGLSLASAQAALTAAGLRGDNVSRTGQCPASSNGDITGASPDTGAQAAYGTEVTLGECVWLTVPNVQGFDDTSAQHAITSSGLTVGTVSQTNNQCLGPAGEVITQTPMTGQNAALGSSVSLTESSGRNTAGKPCGTGGGSPK